MDDRSGSTPMIGPCLWTWTNQRTLAYAVPIPNKTKNASEEKERVFTASSRATWRETAPKRNDSSRIPDMDNRLPDMDRSPSNHAPARRIHSKRRYTTSHGQTKALGSPTNLGLPTPRGYAPLISKKSMTKETKTRTIMFPRWLREQPDSPKTSENSGSRRCRP